MCVKSLTSFIFLILIVANFNVISQINLPFDQQTSMNENIIDTDVSENSFIDTRDNQKYKYVNIGEKQWMAENLNVKTPNSLTYNNIEKNGNTFGRLYIWEEAKHVCPDKWRLPTEDEWKHLEAFIGLSPIVIDSIGWRGGSHGNILKSKNRKTWLSDMHINDSIIGFDAIAGGVAYDNNYFANIGLGGYFWTATNYYSFAWSRYISYDTGEIFRNISVATWYFSVRCIKK